MKTFLIFSCAALLASPALAQDAGAAADPAAQAQQPAAQGASKPADVNAAVDAEFPTHDADGNGALSDAEFGAWIKGLKKKSDPNTTDAELDAYVGAAFTQADADKDGAVSKAEFAAFVQG